MKKKLKFRNPFAQLAQKRKAGAHQKTNKQLRKKQNQQKLTDCDYFSNVIKIITI